MPERLHEQAVLDAARNLAEARAAHSARPMQRLAWGFVGWLCTEAGAELKRKSQPTLRLVHRKQA